jgi:hypothetical protein
MDKAYENLKTVLEEQARLYGQSVTVATEMNAALKIKDVDGVRKSAHRFDSLSVKIESLEGKRLAMCDELGRRSADARRHAGLQGIMDALPENEQREFTAIRRELKNSITALAGLSTSNQLLVEESLLALNKNFDIIAQTRNKPAGYKQTGVVARQSVRKNLVNQIA